MDNDHRAADANHGPTMSPGAGIHSDAGAEYRSLGTAGPGQTHQLAAASADTASSSADLSLSGTQIHKPHLPNNDVPEEFEPGAPPVEPDEGPVPAFTPDGPGHEPDVDAAANQVCCRTPDVPTAMWRESAWVSRWSGAASTRTQSQRSFGPDSIRVHRQRQVACASVHTALAGAAKLGVVFVWGLPS